MFKEAVRDSELKAVQKIMYGLQPLKAVSFHLCHPAIGYTCVLLLLHQGLPNPATRFAKMATFERNTSSMASYSLRPFALWWLLPMYLALMCKSSVSLQ